MAIINQHTLKNRLCSTGDLYRFETTSWWINDDRSFIFGWTVPLSVTSEVVVVCVTEMINATTQFVLNVRPTQYWVNNLNSRAYSTYYRNLKRQKKKKKKTKNVSMHEHG